MKLTLVKKQELKNLLLKLHIIIMNKIWLENKLLECAISQKKNIAGIVSEVLILGAIEKDGKVVLVHPSQKVENGLEIA